MSHPIPSGLHKLEFIEDADPGQFSNTFPLMPSPQHKSNTHRNQPRAISATNAFTWRSVFSEPFTHLLRRNVQYARESLDSRVKVEGKLVLESESD